MEPINWPDPASPDFAYWDDPAGVAFRAAFAAALDPLRVYVDGGCSWALNVYNPDDRDRADAAFILVNPDDDSRGDWAVGVYRVDPETGDLIRVDGPDPAANWGDRYPGCGYDPAGIPGLAGIVRGLAERYGIGYPSAFVAA